MQARLSVHSIGFVSQETVEAGPIKLEWLRSVKWSPTACPQNWLRFARTAEAGPTKLELALFRKTDPGSLSAKLASIRKSADASPEHSSALVDVFEVRIPVQAVLIVAKQVARLFVCQAAFPHRQFDIAAQTRDQRIRFELHVVQDFAHGIA